MRRMILLVALLAILPFSPGTTIARETDADTATLEIVCTGLRNGDIAVFDVYGPEGGKIYSVALQGTGPGKAVRRRIIGLKPGHYRVVSANWDWTYDKSPASPGLTASKGETAVFSFSASKRSGIPLNYENGKLNVFKAQ